VGEMRLKNSTFGILCSVPGLIVLLAFIAYPLAYNFVVSLMKYKYTMGGYVGFSNYLRVISSRDFKIGWRVAFYYSVGSSGLAFLVSLVMAESLRRIKRLRAFFRTLVILPWSVPLVLSGIVFKWMFDGQIGIVNYVLRLLGIVSDNIAFLYHPTWALATAMVGTAYVYVPFMTVLIHAGMESVPAEVYEAASIDGADELQKFRYVTLPLVEKQMLIAFFIVWMFTFRTPDLIYALTKGGPGKATFHAGLYLMRTIYSYLNFGHGAAISVLMFITVALVIGPVLYFVFVKRG
jgi:multiple sugar transport system permease protein